MTRFARHQKQKRAHSPTTWEELSKDVKSPHTNDESTATKASHRDQLAHAREFAAKKDKRREHRRVKRIRKKESAKVCFHCRMPGHGMADCPMLKDDVEQGTDICFKCGSTEHSARVCTAKLPEGKRFAFAKCFVCGETGHLSATCPDNPRGLYPNGGCCGLCGSVEHYKRDCPDRPVKDEVTVYRACPGDHRVSLDDDLELHEHRPASTPAPAKRKPKVVKF